MSRLPGFRLIVIATLLLSGIGLFKLNQLNSTAKAATADHVVISEIKTGGPSDDEFVELYNPTNLDIDLTGWRLTRKNTAGTEANLLSSISGTIPAYGYFLIAHPNHVDTYNADAAYSAASNALTNNFTVLLYSDAGETLIDKVGMGTAADYNEEAAPNPSNDESIERKAHATSTPASMVVGGADEFLGNAYNTNNNATDFVTRSQPQPQNSQSQPQVPPANDTPVDPIVLTTTLSGANEVPPVSTDATGEGIVTLYPDSNYLTFIITYDDLSDDETASHIHGPAGVNENTGVLYDLPVGNVKAGVLPLNPDHLEHFTSGLTYINIHSSSHQSGEIRGQLIPTVEPDPTPTPDTPTPTPDTPTPTPTDEPDVTPTPTDEPDVTPSPTPTDQPVDDPTPTPEPVTPTPTPSDDGPTPEVVYQSQYVVCEIRYRSVRMFWTTVEFPSIYCYLQR